MYDTYVFVLEAWYAYANHPNVKYIYFDYHDKFTIGIVQLHTPVNTDEARVELGLYRAADYIDKLWFIPVVDGKLLEPMPHKLKVPKYCLHPPATRFGTFSKQELHL